MAQFLTTTSALGSGGTWTSVTKNTDRADTLTGSAFADQAGTLFVEQSGDTTHWDVSQSVAVTANTGTGFKIDLLLPYYRLRYVNGATAQGTLRVFAYATSAGAQE